MNFKFIVNLFCISLISLSVEASSFYKLYELDDTYSAQCTGEINKVDIKTISQLKITSNVGTTNNNFEISVKEPGSFETFDSLFIFDVPAVNDSSIGPSTIWSCPARGWFQVKQPCSYKQISNASYVENVLSAQRQIMYLAQDGSGNILNVVTSRLAIIVNKDKTLSIDFQRIDQKYNSNNESFQCNLIKK